MLMDVHPVGFLEDWVFGDFQSLKPNPDEHRIQPIEASQLARARLTGDRTRNTPRAGWQLSHVAIDDHSRVGFSQVLRDDTSHSACDFLIATLRPTTDRPTSPGALPSCCAAWASSTSARGPIRHISTARPGASSRRSCANGHTPIATPARTPERLSCSPGCSTTTSAGHTPASRTNLPPLDSASTGTTS